MNKRASQQLYDRIWLLILRKRGQNLIRGRTLRIPSKALIGIEKEARGNFIPNEYLWINIGAEEKNCAFEHDGKLVTVADVGDLEAWLEIALQICRRQQAYIQTRDDRAEYKK